MAVMTVPTIDAAVCSAWTEQDRNLYNKLPVYLQKMMLKNKKNWQRFTRLLGKRKWESNMGNLMRAVSKVPSPNLRQMAFPNAISSVPKKDVIDVRERTVDAIIFKHRFESPILNYLPSFQDFLTDHVDYCAKDITEKITRFDEVFARGHIFHQSPYLWAAGASAADGNGQKELKLAQYSNSSDKLPTSTYDSDNKKTTFTGYGKTSEYLKAFVANNQLSNLSLDTLFRALTSMETDLGMLPYDGNGQPGTDNSPAKGRFVLICSSEAYNQFIYDPFLLRFKNLNLDVIQDVFKGNLFGRITCMLEDQPLRFDADGLFYDPETRELDENAFNFGESVPFSKYVNSDYEVAWLLGYGEGYETIEIGPPPKDFAGKGMPNGYGQMTWNGELIFTKNLIVPCQDANGNNIVDTNKYGEYLQIIAQTVLGIVGVQKRSIIPIIFKRARGAQSPIIIQQ